MDNLLIHGVWILAGAGFGTYMYKQGLVRGAQVGVKSAMIYLSISGKHSEAEGLSKFIHDLSERGYSFVDKNDSKDEED